MFKKLILLMTHLIVGCIGFAAGIYALPILIEPPSPTSESMKIVEQQALFEGEFKRNLMDSDALHWGEGKVLVSRHAVSFQGKLAPGPDYKLYLSPEFVETESDFLRLKTRMAKVGDVKTFNDFLVNIDASIDPAAYNSVVVWCETFGQFITATKYR